MKWSQATMVGDYDKRGVRNPKWDREAREALTALARAQTYGPQDVAGFPENVTRATGAAIAAGCTDPLIKYFSVRYDEERHNTNEIASLLKDVCVDLLQSDYSAVRKFYACIRAVEAGYKVSGRPRKENPDSVANWNLFKRAQHELHSFLADKTAPVEEVDDACHEYLRLASRLTGDLDWVFGKTEPLLFANWPKSSVPYLLKGECYATYAWASRGNSTADKVSPEGWQGFADRLAVAQAALEQAWKINPRDARIAREMMTVELGQGKGRERMELWFQRAMELSPNYYEACQAKLYYLEPKWYGSPEDTLRFGRECVTSEKWTGWVPLLLVEAHDTLAKYFERKNGPGYWKQPAVWPDIKASFEKFFQLNPEAWSYRHNYARYAFWCEQWDTLNEQLKLIKEIDYDYFGGRDEFEKMVKLAAEHGAKSAKKPEPTTFQ